MANTGYGAYRILEEIDLATGLLTGKEKLNLIGDPDYVAPILSDRCNIIIVDNPDRSLSLSVENISRNRFTVQANRVTTIDRLFIDFRYRLTYERGDQSDYLLSEAPLVLEIGQSVAGYQIDVQDAIINVEANIINTNPATYIY